MTDKRARQGGQALVEMALVMPALLLLIFGSLYLSYAFMQRSVMNGAAFMAARTVAVHSPGEAQQWATDAETLFVENAKLGPSHWLRKAELIGRPDGVKMSVPGDTLWSITATLASIPAGAKSGTHGVVIAMAPEYVKNGSTSGRPATASVIDYSVHEGIGFGNLFASNPLALLFVDISPRRRIYEPDRHGLKSKGGGAGEGKGDLDDQLGAIYVDNTHWLDHHKGQLGLLKGKPNPNSDQRPVLDPEDSHFSDLKQMGVIFTAATETAQSALKLVGVLGSPVLKGVVEKVVNQIGAPLLEKADNHLGNVVRDLEAREAAVLTP